MTASAPQNFLQIALAPVSMANGSEGSTTRKRCQTDNGGSLMSIKKGSPLNPEMFLHNFIHAAEPS